MDCLLTPHFAEIDGFSFCGQPDGMKRRTLLIVIATLLVGISVGWTGRGFIASDRCLDRGGAWDDGLDACKLPIGNGR
ncbi:hypothetical protein IAG41_20295 [Sphingomonas sp. JC676]|uniref:hypothetical protein n=1 Tax=Sphingomonas sp. JC676 TaxID=2768065 RepID=UPI001657C428|nr:hypothetical protein [Sphingomonas sp. JC676]MBC9034737.1 hypothetical protein [Sphingomonas sp. JC676]